MRWQYKVAVQKTLSVLPRGERVNYVLQRHVSKKLPASDKQFFLHFDEATRHVRSYLEHGRRPVGEIRAYEFGAGWDVIGPLSFWVLSHQVLVDIDAHIRFELVNHSIAQLARHRAALEERVGGPLRQVDPSPVHSLGDLREPLRHRLSRPCDARSSGLRAGSFDLISNTFTLEHIPREDIAAILPECLRLLADDGIVSSSIDMNDHYAFDDSRICLYNFLRYSDRTWRFINSSLHYQNRMRARDYRALFAAAGLTTIEEVLQLPASEHRAQLRELPLAPRFASRYTLEELEPTAMAVISTR